MMRKGIVAWMIFIVAMSIMMSTISAIQLSSKPIDMEGEPSEPPEPTCTVIDYEHLEPINVEIKSSENVNRSHIPPEELKKALNETKWQKWAIKEPSEPLEEIKEAIGTDYESSATSYDWAGYEFRPKSGFVIYDLRYGYYIKDLPIVGSDCFYLPQHAYLYYDHSKKKGCIYAIQTGNGKYYTRSYYYDTGGYVRTNISEWRERAQILSTSAKTLRAWARNDTNEWVMIGNSENVTETQIPEIDFMSEIYYEGNMDLPATEKNQITLDWVYTNQGWKRPKECLDCTDAWQGTWAKIDGYWTGDNRLLFYCYIQK
ncbi:MAG: hypothetical protein ACXQTW_00230 [Candidatus Methanospirareceae archaeon]